jgi:hypothetical protein
MKHLLEKGAKRSGCCVRQQDWRRADERGAVIVLDGLNIALTIAAQCGIPTVAKTTAA